MRKMEEDTFGGTHHYPRYLLRKFIELYRDNPCLWDHNNYYFREKTVKAAALKKLVKLVKVHIPQTTTATVTKKIESIRSSYRREKARMQKSLEKDSCCIPNLWYYKHLTFLEGSNSISNKGSQLPQQCCEETGTVEYEEPRTIIVSRKSKKKQQSPENTINENSLNVFQLTDSNDSNIEIFETTEEIENVLIKDNTIMEENDVNYYSNENINSDTDDSKVVSSVDRKIHLGGIADEYDAIGMNVAAKLRGMSQNTRIIAEKLINDVLFKAQINGLTTSSQII